MRHLFAHRLFPILPLGAIMLALPTFFPSAYYYRVAGLVLIFGLGTLGLNLLMGLAGQVSLGHAAFLAIGAYAVAIGPVQLGGPPWLYIVGGALLAGLLAFVIGRPILRLKGHYLAVVTLGLGLLLAIVLNNEARLTGGPDGMAVPRFVVFGLAFRSAAQWYWISAAFFLVGAVLAFNLLDSPSGRALRAIHDSEVAARVLGIDVAKKKLAVFVLSAVYASVAGSLFALFNGHITPDIAGFLQSIELVAMVVLGGMGSVVGSLVGAAFLVVLPQTLTVLHDYEHLALGLILMLTMIFLRAGIVPTLARALPLRPVTTLLSVSDLSIAFGGVRALEAVSFDVAAGLVFSIIGPNGAGKTTLFNAISGLYTAEAGRVRLAGEDVTGRYPEKLARCGLSRTFQNLELFGRMSALENVMVGHHCHERSGLLADLFHLPRCGRQNARTRDALAALDRVGLTAMASRSPATLPYGVLKRLEIARALASGPKLLLLDEPAAGCNATESIELAAVIRGLARDGITVLLVEHDMGVVMDISDRIHVLANGRTIAEGTPAEVRANEDVIAAYLGGGRKTNHSHAVR